MSEMSLARTLIEEAIKNQSKTLDLGNCGLTDESPELKLLEKCDFLDELNFSTYFRNIDGLIGESANLLENNKLKSIPPLLPINLLVLNLNNNRISKIENLEKLTKLSQLNLRDNQIQDVLPLKNLINQLDIIDLSNNPLEKLNFTEYSKIDIWKSYFKDLEKTETIKVPISYIKVNIIGDGRIGKSQFINFLSNKTLKKGEDETPGVKTTLRTFDKYTLNLWDFGGQNYYHGSHRIMIREQDVNVVMWSRFRKKSNTDEPFRGYNYLLGTAQAF